MARHGSLKPSGRDIQRSRTRPATRDHGTGRPALGAFWFCRLKGWLGKDPLWARCVWGWEALFLPLWERRFVQPHVALPNQRRRRVNTTLLLFGLQA
jgi:hypothetical protein